MRNGLKMAALAAVALAVLWRAPNALAASPSGTNWFQLLASPYTGGDNTGDGGTGAPGDLNYYYVGQVFNTTIQISSDHSNASNIWLDYDTLGMTASNLTTGSYFPSWVSQSIAGGRVMSTGYRTTGYSNGVGSFGSVRWTMVRPTAAAYGTGAPATLDINTGIIGQTTESNISYDGADIMQDAEDFRLHIWADTKKPYALNPGPANAAVGVAVDANYTFDLRDSKNGEGDNSGVGTGVNVATPPGAITANGTDETPYDAYACSGVWGTNLCNTTVNPPSPLGIAGDQRNWDYSTAYTVNVSGYRDLASAAQNQLGDANGPNTMDAKTWTFTTEADTVAPRVVAQTPGRNSTGNGAATNISIDVHDKKAYPGSISGTGVNAASCRFDVWSASFATTTYQQGAAGVADAAIDYGYNYLIDPATDFAQNEWVYVRARDCQDMVSNTMAVDQWRFQTSDTDPPFVDTRLPANDQGITAAGTVSFHVKDLGVGVDLANLVVYVNGIYYKNVAGGAGSVTTNGTRITYASTTAFSSVSGTPNDYTVTIDPVVDFTAGEAVPTMVYARDFSGNLMERDVWGMCVGGGTGQTCGNGVIEGNEVCDDGNVVAGDGCSANCLSTETCGNSLRELSEQCDDGNTVSGDGCSAVCAYEGLGGSGSCGTASSGGGGGPSVAPLLNVNLNTVSVIQLDESSVLVTWLTNIPATSRTLFDTQAAVSLGAAPNYGYARSTAEQSDQSLYHAVTVGGLETGKLYAFRPVSRGNGQEVIGPEVMFAPVWKTTVVKEYVTTIGADVCPAQPSTKPVSKPGAKTVPPAKPTVSTGAQAKAKGTLSIIEIKKESGVVFVKGKATPRAKLKIKIF